MCLLLGCMLLSVVGASAQGNSPDFLPRLQQPADFELLKGKPLNEKYGQVESIKIVWDLRTERMYFVSSERFEWHYDFCRERLGFWQSNYLYNQANYADSPNRQYALANINHLVAGDRWTLELTSADQMPIDLLCRFYRRVVDSCFVGERLALFLNTPRLAAAFASPASRKGIAVITPDEVYGSLVYQALNCKIGYGYLRRLPVDSLEQAPPGPTDIVVLDGPALDIPAVAGLLSPEFQTPLSHLNVLCKNRGTPFLAQKGIWEDSLLRALENQLVFFQVYADSFTIKPASLSDAQKHWASRRPANVMKLKLNLKPTAMQRMDKLGMHTVSVVGGKASNFAVLARLAAESHGKWRVPEGAFAIPFHWYWKHFMGSGAKAMADSLLANSQAMADSKLLKTKLDQIRAKMEAYPLDPLLINEVSAIISKTSPASRMRFRSSTNAEDIEGFNGAGLYESRTGIVGDSVRTIEKAIREVWASLWNFRAFQEREYYRIDHGKCAMGLLVHRSFPEESANGVAITKNLYRPDYYGFVINVQIGEVSVVSPPPGVTCDQLICYSDSDLDFYRKKRIVEYISTSSINGGKPVLNEDQVILLTEQLAVIKRYYYEVKYASYRMQDGLGQVGSEDYYRFALDVEFKFDGPQGVLYIKQVRPFGE